MSSERRPCCCLKEETEKESQSHQLANSSSSPGSSSSSSPLLARPHWPRASFHPRSVVLPSTSTTSFPPLFLPSICHSPFLLSHSRSFAFLVSSLTSHPSGFSSPHSPSLSLHPLQLTQTLAEANVFFYLILHTLHFGCQGGESISTMVSLNV